MQFFAIIWSSVERTQVYSPQHGKEVEMLMRRKVKLLIWKKASSIPLPKERGYVAPHIKSFRISETDTVLIAVNAPL